MPRRSARREDLAEAATDYALAHGLIGLSPAPARGGVGTSDRMLLYHFRDKDDLVSTLLRISNDRSVALVRALPPTAGVDGAVRRLWQAVTSPEQERYQRMYVEAAALGLFGTEPYASVVREANAAWGRAAAGYRGRGLPEERSALRAATLIDAGVHGLPARPAAGHRRVGGRADRAGPRRRGRGDRSGQRVAPAETRHQAVRRTSLSRQRARCSGRCQAASSREAVHGHGPRAARPAAGHGTGGPSRRRSAPAAAARRTTGTRPPAMHTGPRPGSAAQRGTAAVHTSAPSSITATAHVAAVAVVLGQQPLGHVPLGLVTDGAASSTAAHGARQHAAHVGVEHDVPAAESEGRDGGRRVVAHARQRPKRVVGGGHRAAVVGRRSRWPPHAGAGRASGTPAGPRRAPPPRSARRPASRVWATLAATGSRQAGPAPPGSAAA